MRDFVSYDFLRNHQACAFFKGNQMGSKMGSLGLLTLGHSPRRDITPSLQTLLGKKMMLREAGALGDDCQGSI